MTTPATDARFGSERAGAPKRREPELTFLRWVPGDSVIHRLWPGTKLIAAAELALVASIAPSWLTRGVISGVVALGLVLARIPPGAFPRFPRGLYTFVVVGLSLNALATTPTVVHLGPVPISLGALAEAGRFFLLGVVVIVSAALVGWTTRLGTVAPALSRLGRPFRTMRLPVDEWVVAIALALRCLPLLLEEMRTLAAARRLRHRAEDDRRTVHRAAVEIHDLVSTAIIVSLRRAHDLADAITARGGIAAISDAEGERFGWRDVIALAVVTAVVAALLVVAIL
jgi:energy-coupling factor transporter transmembrane protein EcfT